MPRTDADSSEDLHAGTPWRPSSIGEESQCWRQHRDHAFTCDVSPICREAAQEVQLPTDGDDCWTVHLKCRDCGSSRCRSTFQMKLGRQHEMLIPFVLARMKQ